MEIEETEIKEENGFIYLAKTDLDGGKDIPYFDESLSYNLKQVDDNLNYIGLFSVMKFERVDKNKGAIVVYSSSGTMEIGVLKS